jgi:hypothetical protein
MHDAASTTVQENVFLCDRNPIFEFPPTAAAAALETQIHVGEHGTDHNFTLLGTLTDLVPGSFEKIAIVHRWEDLFMDLKVVLQEGEERLGHWTF